MKALQMDSGGKRPETTTGLRIRRFIEVLTDWEDYGFLLLLVDFELPSLLDSCKITQHTWFELKNGHRLFVDCQYKWNLLLAFSIGFFASSQADLGYRSVARCSGPDYCNKCKNNMCIYIYIYMYLEPKWPLFWKIQPIKLKVNPPKKGSVGF